MSYRNVASIASTKKRDNRLQVTYSGGDFVPVNDSNLVAGTIYNFLYMPTAMTPSRSTVTAFPDLPSYRTKSEVYMRGYKETVNLNITDGRSWMWRRICFTFKGPGILNASDGPGDAVWAEAVPLGYTRPVLNISTSMRNNLQSLLFEGVGGRDWVNPLIAKVDRTRVLVQSDVTRTINPGSTGGKRVNFKLWHPMNKMLYYNDDEAGTDQIVNHYSVSDRRGMGDYYIYDQIASSVTDAASAGFQVSGTLYFHEK